MASGRAPDLIEQGAKVERTRRQWRAHRLLCPTILPGKSSVASLDSEWVLVGTVIAL